MTGNLPIQLSMRRYCANLFTYARRESYPIRIGSYLVLGGGAPVVIQSMTTTPTAEVDASAQQVQRIGAAGAALVRLTVPGRTEAERLLTIRRRIEERECYIPLAADVHFNPQVAQIAAQYVHKVRINPGNFVDRNSTGGGEMRVYTDAEYAQELERIRVELVALIEICRHYHTVLRIGVNHGSLSERIMGRYGNTTDGMVESAMEFLAVCQSEGFERVVVSMKSSHTRTMVEAYRKLVARMDQEGMAYPLHLGVTEAGEGEDGRVRSAVGIGALMADGLGDTIRVSLTEPPENEIVPAQILADYFVGREMHHYIPAEEEPLPYDPYTFSRRQTDVVEIQVLREGELYTYRIGGDYAPLVVGPGGDLDIGDVEITSPRRAMEGLDVAEYPVGNRWIICTLEHLMNAEFTAWLRGQGQGRVLVFASENANWVGELRACFVLLMRAGLRNPVILSRGYEERWPERLQIHAAADFGALLIDGFGDGMWIVNEVYEKRYTEDAAGNVVLASEEEVTPDVDLSGLSLSILQATGARLSRTEVISCPGCGRTLFELQHVSRAVKERFGHYPGLKIAVMGCIVNGPGEMADAHFGYVGAGPGVVSLYRGREVVEHKVPEAEALDRLETLIAATYRSL